MEYKIVDARTIYCSTTSDKILEVDYNYRNCIIENTVLNKGDKINFKINLGNKEFNTYYKANYFFPCSKLTVSISEFLKTDSTDYILPMLGYAKEYFNENLLVNCYLKSEEYNGVHKDRNDLIFLVYRFLPHFSYTEFEPKLTNLSNFIDQFDNIDKRFTTFVFKCPDRWNRDYSLFIEGKFKDFTQRYKKQVYLFHNIIHPNHPQQIDTKNSIYRILENDLTLRKQIEDSLSLEYEDFNGRIRKSLVKIPDELSLKSKPDIEKETFKLEI